MGNHHILNTVEFLYNLHERGEELTLIGEELHYRTRKGKRQPHISQTLHQHKAEVVAWLREREATQSCYPLSQGQLGLWLDWQRNPDNVNYNHVTVARLAVDVQLDLLRQAAQWLVDRHPVLRTIYPFVNDRPMQQVEAHQTVDFMLVDGTTWTQAQIDAWIEAERERTFDLGRGPVMRIKVLQRYEAQHRPAHLLHWTFNHIATDLFTQKILQDELTVCYQALREGQQPVLPLNNLTYRDFVRWEQDILQIDEARLATFWQTQLGDSPPLLNLSALSGTSAAQSHTQKQHSKTLAFRFDDELAIQLRAYARSQQTTLYTLLLSAYQVLISRYTGQSAFFVNSPTAVRDLSGWKESVGYMVNPVLLRADLAAEISFATLLQHTQQTVTAAMAHHQYPYHAMLRHWHKQITANQLHQGIVGFSFYPIHQRETDAALMAEILMDSQHGLPEPIALSVVDSGDRLDGSISYHANQFDCDFIERMVGHFQTLLTGIVTNHELRSGDLPLLTAAERHQVLVDWNNTTTDYPRNKCVHHLFEDQVARTPDAVAVVLADQQLTYAELNARANQLAHHLQSLGVGPEVLVGICVERSIEMVVGLLGTFKSGGAYVPLDPTYPPDRLAFMLQDAAPHLIVTHAKHRTLFQSTARLICLDDDALLKQQPTCSPDNRVTPKNLAYVIYTSGSTGRPKGVLLEHHGLCNLTQAQIDIYNIQRDSRLLQLVSPNFDVSISDMAITLCAGATLVLAPDAQQQIGETLEQTLRAQAITHLELTPSLLATINPKRVPYLQTVIVGGEVTSPELVAQWSLGRRFFNAYGPTETTVCATIMDCTAWHQPQRSPPIGRPIANMQVYLLDQYHQLVPIGVPGELYIGGAGLARGYHNQPELTKEKFIANPFGPDRLYKTGDLARWLVDGTIEFLGRIDQQVKLRGFRIELGEIEVLLSQHPAVQEVVVIVREDIPGEKRLVAYILPDKERMQNERMQNERMQNESSSFSSLPLSSDWRSHLQTKLPDYMIPSAFVMLDALPLTPNGKVDRKALPAPDKATLSRHEGYAPPRNAAEATLATIWATLLHLERVGIQDNFFEIGGDSILSMQMITHARKMGIAIKPQQVFQYQTIAALLSATPTAMGMTAEQSLVTGTAPLTPIQHRFFALNLPDPHKYNQSVLLTMTPTVNLTWLTQALQSLLQQHDALRLRFQQTEHGWQQTHAELDGQLLLHIIDATGLSDDEFHARLNNEAAQIEMAINITTGPLMGLALFQRGGDQPCYLLWILHHLVVDGVSWRILLEDLQTAYQQLQHTEPLQLLPPTTSYKAWAEWLHTEGANAVVSEVDYWQQHLQGNGALPVDYPDGHNTYASLHSIAVCLSEAETQALLQQVHTLYHTQINDLLLTALLQAMAQWTGREQLLIDLEIHGREPFTEQASHIDLSKTVGWFTSYYPMSLALAETQPGLAILSVKEQLRQIPNRGMGYALLRYLCQVPELVQAREPGLIFNYLGQFDQALQPNRQAADPQALIIGIDHMLGGAYEPIAYLDANGNHPVSHFLDIEAMVVNGQLKVEWFYSENLYRCATIEQVANQFITALQALIAHCCDLLAKHAGFESIHH